jgi:DNA-binding NarL/FixJ family response regulator
VKHETNNEKPPQYYAVCLRNEYIRLSKKEAEITRPIEEADICAYVLRNYVNEELKKCTEKQQKVAFALAQGYSVTEIAKAFGCSRQAVNKVRLRVREKLRDYVT